jgi:hypothetical protein
MPARFGLLPFCLTTLLAAATVDPKPVTAQSEDQSPTIEKLLKSGWEVTGFASAGNNRNALVLFKHPKESYLVQCLTGYDVTRTPRQFVNCYTLR